MDKQFFFGRQVPVRNGKGLENGGEAVVFFIGGDDSREVLRQKAAVCLVIEPLWFFGE